MFSVVIPLYNKELSIKKTIGSVLNQTCQDFEIVVVNDGSTDASVKVVESINDNRIRLVHQDNQGVSAARNKGIKEAKFEWVAFLDGDDLWNTNHLSEAMIMIEKYPESTFFSTSYKYSDGRKKYMMNEDNKIFEVKNYFKEALKRPLVWTSVAIIKKNMFKNLGGFNELLNRGEDVELWSRLATSCNLIKSSVITAVYKVDAENRTSLSKDVPKTHVYHFKLDTVVDLEERKYYEQLILNRLYEYIRAGYFNCYLILRNKHKTINDIDVFLYILSKFRKKISP